MNESNLLSLNSDCMFEIFKYIKHQCEAEKFQKHFRHVLYADLINFAVSCDKITNLFYEWDKKLFKLLKIDNYITPGMFHIDFGSYYHKLKNSSQTDQTTFWQNIVAEIRSHMLLPKVDLKYVSGPYNERHLEVFEMIINALQTRHELKELRIFINGYSLDSYLSFPQLEALHLDVKMSADVLVENCRLNPTLRELSILSTEIHGRLSDIARNENMLPKLEMLYFQMKDGIDAAEYAPLAKLPKVHMLKIGGAHEVGTLRHFFNALAAKETKQIPRFLWIADALMNDEETDAICEIKSLEHLICGFSESKSIGKLTQLTKLKRLEISSNHRKIKAFSEVFKILKESEVPCMGIEMDDAYFEYSNITNDLICMFRVLYVPEIDCYTFVEDFEERDSKYMLNCPYEICEEILQIDGFKPVRQLNCHFVRLNKINLLGQLAHLRELTMVIPSALQYEANYELKNLFQILASKPSTTLQYLDIKGVSIDFNLVKYLAKINSLETLRCTLSSSHAIPLLSGLTQLKHLFIESIHESEDIFQDIHQILSSCRNENISIECNSPDMSIRYVGQSNQLDLALKETVPISPSDLREDCKELFIYDKFRLRSIESLFKALVTNKNIVVNELFIDSTLEWTPTPPKKSREEVLTFRFSDSQMLKVFKQMAKTFRTLLSKSCDMNELITLLFSNSCENIKIWHRKGKISYDKSIGELSLETNINLQEDDSDPNFLTDQRYLQALYNNSLVEKKSFQDIFSELPLRPLQNLTKLTIGQGRRIQSDDLLKIANIKFLRFLKCGFSGARNIEVLAQLEEIQELTITAHERGTLRNLFIELSRRSSGAFQSLIVENTELIHEELEAIADINSLRRLECIFCNRDGLPLIPYLQQLALRSHRMSRLFKEPDFYSTSSLQELIISGDPLDDRELMAVAQHKYLRRIEIPLEKLEKVRLLSSLIELNELQIFLLSVELSAVPLNSLNLPKNLHKLGIHNLMMSSGDIQSVFQIQSANPLNSVLAKQEEIYVDVLMDTNTPATEIKSLRYPQDLSNATLLNRVNLPEVVQLNQLVITMKDHSELRNILSASAQSPPILKQLIIRSKYLNEMEVTQISKISSLTTLHCEFNNNEHIQYLRKLKNLKRLTIKLYCNSNALHIYQIIKECKELESFKELGSIQIDSYHIKEIHQILKEVRNPFLQKPLVYSIPKIPKDINDEMPYMDPRYMVLNEK